MTSASAITCAASMAGKAQSDSEMKTASGVASSRLRSSVTGCTALAPSRGCHVGDPAPGDGDGAPEQECRDRQNHRDRPAGALFLPEFRVPPQRELKGQRQRDRQREQGHLQLEGGIGQRALGLADNECGAGGGQKDQAGPEPWHETARSEEHTSELQSRGHLVCRLLLEKKKK